MNKSGPIVVVEDDTDDQEILAMAFGELGFPNEVLFFNDGEKALEFLLKDEILPFLVISDINMPRLNGFELKRLVHTNQVLSGKCVPYLFFTTSVHQKAVIDAYAMSVQGFFLKPSNYPELLTILRVMIEYWKHSYSPANYVQVPPGQQLQSRD